MISQDLHDFYRGYAGRRMLIAEGKLTSRAFLEALRAASHASASLRRRSNSQSDLSKMPNGDIIVMGECGKSLLTLCSAARIEGYQGQFFEEFWRNWFIVRRLEISINWRATKKMRF